MNNDEKIFYVYIYFDTRKVGQFNYHKLTFDMEPFYVGKGHNNRYLSHLKRAKSNTKRKRHKHNKIIKIIKETGTDPKILIFKNNLTEKEANKLERKLIKIIGRLDLNCGPLLNGTDGGDGVKGLKLSEETKSILRIKSTGNKNCLGRKFSDESKRKMSETKLKKHWHPSDETKRQISESLKGNKFAFGTKRTVEQRKRISDGHKGHHHSEETKRKMSESQKGHVLSKETIIKMNEAKRIKLEAKLKNESIQLFQLYKKYVDEGMNPPFKAARRARKELR